MQDVGAVHEQAPGRADRGHLGVGERAGLEVERRERNVLAAFVRDDPGRAVVGGYVGEEDERRELLVARRRARGTTRLWLP